MYLRRHRAALAAIVVCCTLTTGAHAGGSLKDGAPGTHVDWSGIYAGIHGGAGWSRIGGKWSNSPFEGEEFGLFDVPTSAKIDVDGWLAGGHIGLQRQFNRLVLGVEASFTGGWLEGSASNNFSGSIDFGEGTFDWSGASRIEAKVGNLLMLSGRVGHAWDRWLLYLKGGYASGEIKTAAKVDASANFTSFGECIEQVCSIETFSLSARGKTSERHHGFVLGAGFEHMIRPNVILGIEYNYIDLQAKTHKGSMTIQSSYDGIPSAPFAIDTNLRVDPDAIHTVMARLSFKLGQEAVRHAPLK